MSTFDSLEALSLLRELVSGDEVLDCRTGDPDVDDTEHICFYCGASFGWPESFEHESDCTYLKMVAFLKTLDTGA